MSADKGDGKSTDLTTAVNEYRHVIPNELIKKINSLVDLEHAAAGPRGPAGLHVSTSLAVTIGGMIRALPAFQALEAQEKIVATRTLLELNAANKLHAPPLHIVRCVDRHVSRESHCRHYDSHLLTLLVPLQLADQAEHNGDLVVFIPSRPIPSVIRNVAAKLKHGIQRNLPLRLRSNLTSRDLITGRSMRVPCTTGNVYAFNGFISKHANLHITSGQRRSLLIHWYDPGRSAGVSTAMRIARRVSRKASRFLSAGFRNRT